MATLLKLLLAILPLLLAVSVNAITYPTISVAQSPVPYGQSDKINATAQSTLDRIAIFVNSTMVAGPRKNTVNYTVCVSAACLLPGTYAITSEDVDTMQTSQTKLLSITPVKPVVYLQKSSANYGDTDDITIVAPSANDSITLTINGTSSVSYTGTGSFTYTICNYRNGMPCLQVGNYTVSVFDNTENIRGSNQSLSIGKVLPQVQLSTSSATYGATVKVSVIAPSQNDSMELFYSNVTTNSSQINNQSLNSSAGSFTYTICRTPANSTCIPAGRHLISVLDHTENAWSVNRTLTITPVAPELSMLYSSIDYASPNKIYVTSPLVGDTLNLLINNTTVTQNANASFTYNFCRIVSGTNCTAPGTYNVIVFDYTQKAYSRALQMTIRPVPPKISVGSLNATYGARNIIKATAPLYRDNLTLIINNIRYANATGNLTFDMCPQPNTIDCFDAGVYNVSVYDLTQNIYSQNKTVTILPQTGPTSTVPTATTIQPSTTAAPTTTAESTPSSPTKLPLGTVELILGAIAVFVVAAIAVRFYLGSRKPPEPDTTY
ncbi:MAG: hypothetical protein KGH69_03305 [Candidatus Micrarchaeota archaeon]|nr:hypothetical protein [Candidatus Micrarchaeota archaeon]